jgi:hypothetical protein
VEFKKIGHNGLMCMKKTNSVIKEAHGIQILVIDDSQGDTKDDQRHLLQIWESYSTELYDRPYRPKT